MALRTKQNKKADEIRQVSKKIFATTVVEFEPLDNFFIISKYSAAPLSLSWYPKSKNPIFIDLATEFLILTIPFLLP